MATHSSILAWEILWAEEPGEPRGLTGSQRVGHASVTKQQQFFVTDGFVYFKTKKI